ncbi:hypothetical protein GEMRC1_013140 [Eukaryota sp. GEM-RC1]
MEKFVLSDLVNVKESTADIERLFDDLGVLKSLPKCSIDDSKIRQNFISELQLVDTLCLERLHFLANPVDAISSNNDSNHGPFLTLAHALQHLSTLAVVQHPLKVVALSRLFGQSFDSLPGYAAVKIANLSSVSESHDLETLLKKTGIEIIQKLLKEEAPETAKSLLVIRVDGLDAQHFDFIEHFNICDVLTKHFSKTANPQVFSNYLQNFDIVIAMINAEGLQISPLSSFISVYCDSINFVSMVSGFVSSFSQLTNFSISNVKQKQLLPLYNSLLGPSLKLSLPSKIGCTVQMVSSMINLSSDFIDQLLSVFQQSGRIPYTSNGKFKISNTNSRCLMGQLDLFVKNLLLSQLQGIFSLLIDWNLMVPFDTTLMSLDIYRTGLFFVLASPKLPHWNSPPSSYEISNFSSLPFIYFICALIEHHRNNKSEPQLFLELINDMVIKDPLLYNYTYKVEQKAIGSIVRVILEYFKISDFLVNSFIKHNRHTTSLVGLLTEVYVFLTDKQLYHKLHVISHLQSLNKAISRDVSTTTLGFQLINTLHPEAKEAVASFLCLKIEDTALGRICDCWLKMAYVHDCPEELASRKLLSSEQGVVRTIRFFLSDPTPLRLRVIGALCDHFDPFDLIQSNIFTDANEMSIIGDVAPLLFDKIFERIFQNFTKLDSTKLFEVIDSTSHTLQGLFTLYDFESLVWLLSSFAQSFASYLPRLGFLLPSQLPPLSTIHQKLLLSSHFIPIALYSKLFAVSVVDLIDRKGPFPLEVLKFSLDDRNQYQHLDGAKCFIIRLLLSRGTEGEATGILANMINTSDGSAAQKQELLLPLTLTHKDFHGLVEDTDYPLNPQILNELSSLKSGKMSMDNVSGQKVCAFLIANERYKAKLIRGSNFQRLFNVFDSSCLLLPLGEILNSDSCRKFLSLSSISNSFIPFNFPNSAFSRIHLHRTGLHLYYCMSCGYSLVIDDCGRSGVGEHGSGPTVFLGHQKHVCPRNDCRATNWSQMDCSCSVPFNHFASNPKWNTGPQPVRFDVFSNSIVEPIMKGLFQYSQLVYWLLGSCISLYMLGPFTKIPVTTFLFFGTTIPISNIPVKNQPSF